MAVYKLMQLATITEILLIRNRQLLTTMLLKLLMLVLALQHGPPAVKQ